MHLRFSQPDRRIYPALDMKRGEISLGNFYAWRAGTPETGVRDGRPFYDGNSNDQSKSYRCPEVRYAARSCAASVPFFMPRGRRLTNAYNAADISVMKIQAPCWLQRGYRVGLRQGVAAGFI